MQVFSCYDIDKDNHTFMHNHLYLLIAPLKMHASTCNQQLIVYNRLHLAMSKQRHSLEHGCITSVTYSFLEQDKAFREKVLDDRPSRSLDLFEISGND